MIELHIEHAQQRAFENAKLKGFHDSKREFGTVIALIHSELSEALEADRHGDADQVAEELADAVIRILDFCGSAGINLDKEITKKMKVNEGRTRLHGKRY